MEKMEIDYRNRIQALFNRVEAAFEGVDPDIAECEQSMGAMIITFADRSRCILSAQPSVNQLWLALASKGTAYHFSWDEKGSQWIDDKGRGIEIKKLLKEHFKEATGIEFKF